MANAKIDVNYEGSALVITDEPSPSIANLLVDPITGRLEIDLLIVNTPFNDVVASQMKEDANYHGIAEGVTDDLNKDVRLLKVDSATGRLIIDAVLI